MELPKIALKKGQEIQGISLEKSDNGGFVLRYTVYTSAPTKNQNGWDDKTFTYTSDQKKEAFDHLVSIYEQKLK